MRIRILPIVIVVAFTLVVVKFFDIVVEKKIYKDALVTSSVKAAAQESEEEGGEEDDEEGRYDEEAYASPGATGPKELEVSNISDMERNLLENLSKRRKELEDWAASISMKENILNATEKKINRKMDELKTLQEEVVHLLEEYKQKENKKTQRLVKIYENMKPGSAARIFDRMGMDLLIEVVGKMKEAKSAKILAKIDPEKAKEITLRLAQQRRLSDR